jgi:hypothetical protein
VWDAAHAAKDKPARRLPVSPHGAGPDSISESPFNFSRELRFAGSVERGKKCTATGGNPIKKPRETEWLNGELEIDYQHNRVMFHPNALREFTFSLPLTPLDVDIVRSLTQIGRRLEKRIVSLSPGSKAELHPVSS